MSSLLGQFYTRIRGSQEDIASEGLAYILQRSPASRLALNRLIKSDCSLEFDDLTYTTQNIGDKLERPDVSGSNAGGTEVLIIEAKFWAALTDNQPLVYLSRLGSNSMLMFVCPTLRVRPVFDEIHKRIQSASLNYAVKPENHSISFDGNKHLIVKTWNEILNTIRTQLIQENDSVLLSDVNQIIGLCEAIDSNSFQPFQTEEFAPRVAKRINSYNDLIDKVVDELKKRNLADTQSLNATPQRNGYTRYFRMASLGFSLSVRFDLWERYADTPFWLNIKDQLDGSVWVMTDSFKLKMKTTLAKLSVNIYERTRGELMIPLFPLMDKTEDVVVSEISDQILKLVRHLSVNVE
ncbi:MAG: hypothetical protein SGJ05_06765 [bacterium]|nr:hypothetical protein [bacterium]